MKKLLIALVVVLAVFVSVRAESVKAGVTDYTATWNSTNLYQTQAFSMIFTGLDAASEYNWTIQGIDVQGNVWADFGSYTHVLGAVTDAFVFGPVIVQPYVGDWPFEYTGPFQVVDNYGTTVMKGFVAPDPKTQPIESGTGSGDWALGIGFNTYFNKVHVGTAAHNGICKNAAYVDYFGPWHYQKLPCNSGVQDDVEFALMHYATDCATAWGTTDSIRFYSFAGAEMYRVEIQEIFDYHWNTVGADGCGSLSGTFEGFIVINTSGEDLPFIDNVYADSVFGNFSINPHHWEFLPGVYYYQKRTAANAFIADGEAPFFVSNAQAGREWTIEIATDSIGQNGNLGMVFYSNTLEIWNDYRGARLCQDNSVTWQDVIIYQYAANISQTHPVAPIVTAGDFIECLITPVAIGTTNMTTTDAQVLVFSEFYNVVDVKTFEESIGDLLTGMKLNNNTGKNLMFALVLGFGILFVTLVPQLRKQTFAYLIAWTAIGGVWAVAGPATLLGQSAFVIATVILWLLVLSGNVGGATQDETI